GKQPANKERLRTNIILSDEAIGFSDPDFWGEYNIIEPEKSIESAIRKIQKQLKKSKSEGAAAP
ncbi:MAG: carboxypeptidase-like regulatory domain-containing protein, partial [Eudoraea sp.]